MFVFWLNADPDGVRLLVENSSAVNEARKSFVNTQTKLTVWSVDISNRITAVSFRGRGEGLGEAFTLM